MQIYHLPDHALAHLQTPANQRIFDVLGHDDVRFIGGCVRDALLGITRSDIDLATTHEPHNVLERLSQHHIKAIPTGIKHGTITAVIEGHPIEITTLRNDVACDGRHADVSFTSNWEDDALRRDFTINSLSANWQGTIYDYTGGYQDLFQHQIRFVGNAEDRCQEDYLRILRYFRFFARYGSLDTVDHDAVVACERHASQIKTLSGERIQSEMLKLFATPSPLPALQLMHQHQVLKQILPYSPQFEHLEMLLHTPYPEAQWPLLRLACLIDHSELHSDQVTKHLAQAWKLSNLQRQTLHTYLCEINRAEPEAFQTIEQARPLIRKLGKDHYLALLLLAHAKHPNTETLQTLYHFTHQWEIPVFPLRGSDLLPLGITGRHVGELLAKAENWWEANHYAPTKEQLMMFVQAKG